MVKINKNKLTIFTPTYNRKKTLERLYKSLLEQTNKDFEWIIVDDGSTDNTEQYINELIKEGNLLIKYFKQENQGKMIAHNRGVKEAKGELFTCVDSDDYLNKNAVETIIKVWNKVDKNECTGIVALKISENNKPVGTYMPDNVKYSTLLDLYEKYKFIGDTMLIYKTKIIQKYEFPKIEGEKFIPESYLYDKIDLDGKLYLLNEGLYICEYLSDGYSANINNVIRNNPKGYILYAKQRMELATKYKDKLKAAAKYVLGNWLANKRGYIKESKYKILTILAIPLAYIVYIERYNKRRNNIER